MICNHFCHLKKQRHYFSVNVLFYIYSLVFLLVEHFNLFLEIFLENSVFNSASISAMVGRFPRISLGNARANSYSDIPIGLLTSRSAYSAMTRSFFSQSSKPIVALSCDVLSKSSTIER